MSSSQGSSSQNLEDAKKKFGSIKEKAHTLILDTIEKEGNEVETLAAGLEQYGDVFNNNKEKEKKPVKTKNKVEAEIPSPVSKEKLKSKKSSGSPSMLEVKQGDVDTIKSRVKGYDADKVNLKGGYIIRAGWDRFLTWATRSKHHTERYGRGLARQLMGGLITEEQFNQDLAQSNAAVLKGIAKVLDSNPNDLKKGTTKPQKSAPDNKSITTESPVPSASLSSSIVNISSPTPTISQISVVKSRTASSSVSATSPTTDSAPVASTSQSFGGFLHKMWEATGIPEAQREEKAALERFQNLGESAVKELKGAGKELTKAKVIHKKAMDKAGTLPGAPQPTGSEKSAVTSAGQRKSFPGGGKVGSTVEKQAERSASPPNSKPKKEGSGEKFKLW